MQRIKEKLKLQAISQSLFEPTSLENAIKKLTFIQADPIRSPAPAQDLILRQRVKDYHVGDLEKHYISLNLEEDFLYAHGFMVREIWQLLHPRSKIKLTKFDRQVLEKVSTLGEILPKQLEKHFEQKRVINWWGGYSRASKMALEKLHYYGLLRVARRQKGMRIYQAMIPPSSSLSTKERLEKLVMAIVYILAPVTDKALQESLHRIRRHFGETRSAINNLMKKGELEKYSVDGFTYYWPSGKKIKKSLTESVKLLAPFDPIVRDRHRFEHLWGWQYRFEAYTPKQKRIRGYYALPMLWNTEVIGWANITVVKNNLSVDTGFIKKIPDNLKFKQALEEELSKMKSFLKLK